MDKKNPRVLPCRGKTRGFLCAGGQRRHLIPGAAIEAATGFFLVDSAPLFEKEGDLGLHTLVANVRHPLRVERARTRAGFAADNSPMNSFQVQVMQRPKQRFQRQEFGFSARAP